LTAAPQPWDVPWPMAKHLKKEERRLQLMEAALRAFGQRSYHATQISHIIAEAGVARGTFYLYFESKREIFDDLVTEISGRVQKVIHNIEVDSVEGILQQILSNIERATHLLLQNPLYIKIFFSDAVGLDKAFDDRLKKFYRSVLTSIRNGLQKGQDIGLIREGDIAILSLCLMGSLKEIFYQYVLGNENSAPEKIIQEVYRLVLHALVKPELIDHLIKKVPLPETSETKPHLRVVDSD